MGLLGLGLPMPRNPVGGSQWMREKGLTREPQNRTAGLLGEAAGNILPIVAAAKGPQIAQGLLQAGENLRAPTPMNTATRGQAGAIVYHGSPHRFDKFDSSKIGTGEGAQAYGHGLYLAESPEVAKHYATGGGGFVSNSGKSNVYFDGKWLDSFGDKATPEGLAKYVMTQSSAGSTVPEKVAALRKIGKPDAADWLAKNAGRFEVSGGHLYKVDLSDSAIARMLDWDKPLSQQPEAVRKALGSNEAVQAYMAKANAERAALNAANPGRLTHPVLGKIANRTVDESTMAAKTAYEQLTAKYGADKAAQMLRDAGVPGVRYLDGGSRTAGAGSSNFVVFPGNEGLLTILGRE
jgi:hypothetical protein